MFKIQFYCLAILLLVTCISSNVAAQYFYKDIWNARQLVKEFAIIKNEHIRVVSFKSFEGNGEPSEGFFCEKQIDKNYKYSQTVSRSNITDQSLLTSYFSSNGLITKTTDSTETSVSRTEYEYDNGDRIKTVTAFTRAGDEANGIIEVHEYSYNTEGKLEKMILKRNNSVVSVVNFTVDEKGNITDEEETIKGVKGKKYFYYYDDKNHLTDIVHYNQRAKRLLPDYMYEYEDNGEIKQMISTQEGSSNYFIWRYSYNDKNLKESEKCYSKERKLVGKVEYEYR